MFPAHQLTGAETNHLAGTSNRNITTIKQQTKNSTINKND